ncbi:Structural maintenance of chromosomes protein 2-1 [Trebouxia sp. C0009 RCD-2024]
MYIEEVTIDGFKSYAQRVTVPNFDRYFNAITGLNGSGKSNILDSICFVLGITNLQQVRANSLQDLVYKQGQAGITKATVSIVFNNEEKQSSPVGFDHDDKITVTRQVPIPDSGCDQHAVQSCKQRLVVLQLVIGGRNKYLINGHNAQPSRVQNLFHSVQLNVNNPHFLIMQGRITKVLNMKPPEILGMLEEAAGTRMYESKKEAALRTLDKKQVKVEEINKVLHDDILPALEKLRKEKGQYMEWQAADAKLGHLKRFCAAYRYQEAQRLHEDGQGEINSVKAKIEEGGEAQAGLEAEMQTKDADIQTLQARFLLGAHLWEHTQSPSQR